MQVNQNVKSGCLLLFQILFACFLCGYFYSKLRVVIDYDVWS